MRGWCFVMVLAGCYHPSALCTESLSCPGDADPDSVADGPPPDGSPVSGCTTKQFLAQPTNALLPSSTSYTTDSITAIFEDLNGGMQSLHETSANTGSNGAPIVFNTMPSFALES